MALFIRQDNERSELQQRVAAELREKAKRQSQLTKTPDGVQDSDYLKDTKKTTSLAWIWLLLIVLAAGIFIWLTIFGSSR